MCCVEGGSCVTYTHHRQLFLSSAKATIHSRLYNLLEKILRTVGLKGYSVRGSAFLSQSVGDTAPYVLILVLQYQTFHQGAFDREMSLSPYLVSVNFSAADGRSLKVPLISPSFCVPLRSSFFSPPFVVAALHRSQS